jgi:hypothetical protein
METNNTIFGIVELLSAFVAPITAAIVTYIAIQQWRTNRSQHKYQLFDRRFGLYKAAHELILLVRRKRGHVSDRDWFSFKEKCLTGRFLLHKEALDYVCEIDTQTFELLRLNDEISDLEKDASQSNEVAKLKKNRRIILGWFDKQSETLDAKFEKDLKLGMNL